ncbi:replication restart DNA helicase PriA [Geodermatophilus dictyosporus]|uniref:Probable replication restart protein PriA n=1 Tax=Geodermatophilus dictyosporus TaxID=1523247 RepID=A0A1I5Q0Y6_9ACTN|nr:primosomal protein N' [Geodermatophilus dictyosporus]SFP39865.1 replication restart DNA helicase PriA [Geodermatophilus dictyosporus]
MPTDPAVPAPEGAPRVARVVVDVPLAHLDRPFDYAVPDELAGQVRAGCRVRVRFAGQLVDGVVLELAEASDSGRKLAPLAKLVSPEPVLTPEVAALARSVAQRWAGTLTDVLRLAIPPRRAAAEKRPPGEAPPPPAPPDPAGFARYPAGPSLLAAVAGGRPARAVWTALPGEDWPARLAELCQAALSGGRGALVVVPDGRDLDRLEAAATASLPAGSFVVLRADAAPDARYRRFLDAARGSARVVLGTRAAVFAPVADLGLVAVWDDGDDLHAEPRAPYAHARDVLLHRAHLASCAAVVAATARTAEAQLLVDSGWAHELAADRATLRAAAPRVQALGEDSELARDPAARTARLPSLAHRVARATLAEGAPVLVQVPRAGYAPGLSCDRCRAPARCAVCRGPLGISPAPGPGGSRVPACRWCARPAATFDCPHCHGTKLRASVVGAARTAEELGRAFPGAPVRVSGRTSGVLPSVPAGPSLVVATPGAEPVAEGGYGAALLLDSWALLGRADLRAGEETLRRWANAATLVRPHGSVVVAADAAHPVVQALVRWDPGWLAERELADRRALGFPPATRMAALSGSPAALAEFLAAARLPAGADLLGPVPEPARPGQEGERERYLVRVPRGEGLALATALAEVQGVRSARKASEHVRVQLDPLELV